MEFASLLVDDYYIWLLDLIDGGAYSVTDYTLVLEKLFSTEFIDVLGVDGNRIFDGLDLRYEFADHVGEHIYYVVGNLPNKCSVLEMMIALARRWDYDNMYDPDIGDRSCDWFWLMFSNLGLDFYSDDCYNEEEVDSILDIFMNRKYGKDGKGSLFPTKNLDKNLAKKDIWAQINGFFIENSWLEKW